METSLRIDCTPTEARQMVGSPDLLPLYECLSLALEDWLVCLIGSLDPDTPPPAATRGNDQRPRRTAV